MRRPRRSRLAVADERGRIGDPDEADDPEKPKDMTPVFKTAADRREAALGKYRGVMSKYAGTGAASSHGSPRAHFCSTSAIPTEPPARSWT